MSRVPRLLPLIGVAIGGVVAVNALSGARAVPEMLSATRAMAEEAMSPKGAKGKPAPVPAPDAAPKAQSPLPTGVAGAGPTPLAPVCAPSAADLAKAAGLSANELQVLQSLQARRGQIEDKAKDLDTETQLLNAAEAKLDAKLKAMNGLKADIQALMGEADQKTQTEVDRLVIVYSKMKPADAAAVMAQLDDKVRLPIAAAMKPAILSAILGKMQTADAKTLTEKLAHRFAPIQALADAANAPPSAPPPPAKPAGKDAPKDGKADAKPGAKADAGDDASGDDAADAAPAKAKPAHKRAPAHPKRLAKAAPQKRKPADPAAAKADAALPAKPEAYTAAKDKPADAPATPAPAKAG
jgi:flagellar motility protein MotE (MotC chaperone)